MTDEQMIANWLKTNKPTVIPLREPIESKPTKLLSTHTMPLIYDIWGARIYHNLDKPSYSAPQDETTRNYGD
jgi:hypothetical protein